MLFRSELDANGKPRLYKPKESKPAAPREDKETAERVAAKKVLAEKPADKAAVKETP